MSAWILVLIFLCWGVWPGCSYSSSKRDTSDPVRSLAGAAMCRTLNSADFPVIRKPGLCDMSGLGLTKVPSNVPNTTLTLDLSHNQLAEIGNNSFPSYLVELYLSHNYISGLDVLAFGHLSELLVLDLSYNMLIGSKSFPDDVFLPTSHLRALYLHGNIPTGKVQSYEYSQFPDQALSQMKSLSDLVLDGPAVLYLGRGFSGLTALRKLSFGYEGKACITHTLFNDTFKFITRDLVYLNMSYCGLRTMSNVSLAGFQLQYVDFSNNYNLTLPTALKVFDTHYASHTIQYVGLRSINPYVLVKTIDEIGPAYTNLNDKHFLSLCIQRLDLSHNSLLYINNTQMKYMWKCLIHLELQYNVLNGTQNTFALLDDISKSTVLRSIDISSQRRSFADSSYNPVALRENGRYEGGSLLRVHRHGAEHPQVDKSGAHITEVGERESSREMDNVSAAVNSKVLKQESLNDGGQKLRTLYDSGSSIVGEKYRVLRDTGLNSFLNHKSSHRKSFISRIEGHKSSRSREIGPETIRIRSTRMRNFVNRVVPIQVPPLLVFANFSGFVDPEDTGYQQDNFILIDAKSLSAVDFSNNNVWCKLNVRGLKAIKSLRLSNNDCSDLNSNLFKTMPTLEKLSMDGVQLNIGFQKSGYHLMQPLKSLQYLSLARNGLRNFPVYFFEGNSNLSTLILSRNNFTQLQREWLNLEHLRYLDLSYNSIETIDANVTQTLDDIANERSFFLFLRGNLLSCSCEDLAFIRWIYTTDVVLDNENGYSCKMKDGSIAHTDDVFDFMDHLEIQCVGREIFVIVISLTASLILILVLVSFFYKHRWTLQYMWWKVLMKWGANVTLIESSEGITSDLFVMYSHHDTEWVVGTLVDKLEKQLGFKLTFFGRDFLPGQHIYSEVFDKMFSSRASLFVITNKYLASEYSDFELQMAAKRSLEKLSHKIYVILKDDIPIRRLPSFLQSMWKRVVCLPWTADEDGQSELWKNLEKALRKNRPAMLDTADMEANRLETGVVARNGADGVTGPICAGRGVNDTLDASCDKDAVGDHADDNGAVIDGGTLQGHFATGSNGETQRNNKHRNECGVQIHDEDMVDLC